MLNATSLPSPVANILRRESFLDNKRPNILVCPTHERYESALAGVDANFYSLSHPSVKKWNPVYASKPENYYCHDDDSLPLEEQFRLWHNPVIDLVLSQNKFGQYQILRPIAQALHVPLISLEHTLPVPGWPNERLNQCRQMQGHVNVFISEFSRDAWGFKDIANTTVVHHGIDTGQFSLGRSFIKRSFRPLSVVNDWMNRDWCCGYRFYQEAISPIRDAGISPFVLGDTPGLSKPAKDTKELIAAYQSSLIFVNTSLISPVPTALLEAMACGCCVISTDTCMIPEVITHGENGLLAKTPKEMSLLIHQAMENPDFAIRLGQNAAKTIQERFNMKKFRDSWERVFSHAAKAIPHKTGTYL